MKRRLTRDYPGIFGQLKTGANAMAERLTDIARRLGETAHTVRDASGEISTGSQDLASRTESQARSEEHTSELQSLMRISYAVFCLKKKKTTISTTRNPNKSNKQLHTKC